MANSDPLRFLREPRGALFLGLAGAALLIAAWFLPAMHKLGGGYFSSIEYLNEVQSAFKGSFFYAQLVALPVVVVIIQPSPSIRWGGLAAAGVLGVWLCLPEFGPMGDTPREVASIGSLGIVVAAAATLIAAAERRPGVARWVAWVGAALVLLGLLLPSRSADQQFPNELASLARRESLTRGTPISVVFAAFSDSAASAMIAAAALVGPIVACAGAAAAGLADRRPRLAGGAALALLLYLPLVSLLCFAAALFPGSRYEWDIGVRARYALTASIFWVWTIAGIAGGALATRRRQG